MSIQKYKIILSFIIFAFMIFLVFAPKLVIATNNSDANTENALFDVSVESVEGGLSISSEFSGAKLNADSFSNMQSGTNSSLNTFLLKLLDLAKDCGAVATAFGMFKIILAFKDDNASEKVTGMLALFGGILMMSLSTIVTAAGLLS